MTIAAMMIDNKGQIVTSVERTTGSGQVVFDNLLIVAKDGGNYSTIQGAADEQATSDLVYVITGIYYEDIVLSAQYGGIATIDGSAESGSVALGGASDNGPMVAVENDHNIIGLYISRTLQAAEVSSSVNPSYVAVSSIDNLFTMDNVRLEIDKGDSGRSIYGLVASSTGDDYVSLAKCKFIDTDRGIEFRGGKAFVEHCRIDGDVVATSATEVIIRDTFIDGDLVGCSGSDLYLDNATYVTGNIIGWDSVTYRPEAGGGDFINLDDTPVSYATHGERFIQVNSGETGLQFAYVGADDVYHRTLTGSTYSTLQDVSDTIQSGGVISGGAITDGGSGTIDVASGSGIIKTTDSDIGQNVLFDWSAQSGVSLTDNSINWVYIDYNSGSPQVGVDTDINNVDLHTEIIIGRVYRSGTHISIVGAGQLLADYMTKACLREFELYGIERASGEMLAEETGRAISVTAGVNWCAHSRFTTTSFDCSVSGTFVFWYKSSGTWTSTTSNAINNSVYNDGTNMTSLTTNRYGTRWVYRAYDGEVHVVLGTSNESQPESAENEPAPTDLPGEVLYNAFLIGRIVIQEGGSSFESLDSAFNTLFTHSNAGVVNHNDLSGLQGGTTGEYYHLEATDYNALTDTNAQLAELHTDGDPEFNSVTVIDTIVGYDAYIDLGTRYLVDIVDDSSNVIVRVSVDDKRMGINNTSPQYDLHAKGTSATCVAVESTSPTSYSLFMLGTDNDQNAAYVIAYGSGHVSNPNKLGIKNAYGSIGLFTGTGGSSSERWNVDSVGVLKEVDNIWRIGGTVLDLDFTGTDYDTKSECQAAGLRFSDSDTPFFENTAYNSVVGGTLTHSSGNGWQFNPSPVDEGPVILVPLMRQGNWEIELGIGLPTQSGRRQYFYIGPISEGGLMGWWAQTVMNRAGSTYYYYARLQYKDMSADNIQTPYSGTTISSAGSYVIKARQKNGCIGVWDDHDNSWHDYEGLLDASSPEQRQWGASHIALYARGVPAASFGTLYLESLKLTYLL